MKFPEMEDTRQTLSIALIPSYKARMKRKKESHHSRKNNRENNKKIEIKRDLRAEMRIHRSSIFQLFILFSCFIFCLWELFTILSQITN